MIRAAIFFALAGVCAAGGILYFQYWSSSRIATPDSLAPVVVVARIAPVPAPPPPPAAASPASSPAAPPQPAPRPGAPAAPTSAPAATPAPTPAPERSGPLTDAVDPSAQPWQPITEPEARYALAWVGADPAAEDIWIEAINDPGLSAKDRSNLIEDLNEDGFMDPHNVTVAELPLVINRMMLIEQLAPFAMDKVNADAFAEAYKDLMNMYLRLSGYR